MLGSAGLSWQKSGNLRGPPLGRVNRDKLPAPSGRLGGGFVPSPVHSALPTLPSPPLALAPLPMSSDVVFPGQPVPIPRGPIPQVGPGIYVRDGAVRASLVGVPQYSGSVGLFALFRHRQL